MDSNQQQVPPMPSQQIQKKTSGFAITSLVLGIVSLIPQPLFGIPAGVLALVFGLIARKKIKAGFMNGKGLATSGVILGSIGIVISIIVIILFTFLASTFLKFGAKNMNSIQQQIIEQQQRAMQQAASSSQYVK